MLLCLPLLTGTTRADENAAGRRVWMANLRRIATLSGAERHELAREMAERDWINEWGLCLRYSAADSPRCSCERLSY